MGDISVYHNPRCGKSRGALEILAERGEEVEVIEYLKTPPDRPTLHRILDAIDDPPGVLVRHDARFDELGLDARGYETRDAVVELLIAHPELMQRPVVFRGARAVIGRPSERVLELFA